MYMSKSYQMLILFSFFSVILLTFRVIYNNIRVNDLTSKAEKDNAVVVEEIKETASKIKSDIAKIEKTIVKNEKDQELVDSSQDSKMKENTTSIDVNSVEISALNSNITNNIEHRVSGWTILFRS